MILATDEATPLTNILKKLVEELATAELMIDEVAETPFTFEVKIFAALLKALVTEPTPELIVVVATLPFTVLVNKPELVE